MRHFALIDFLRIVDEAFGSFGTAVEKNVFKKLEKILRDFLVDAELPGVDDSNIEPGRDSVIKEG